MGKKPQDNVALGALTLVVIALVFFAALFLGGPPLENTENVRVLVRHDLPSPQLGPGAAVVCGPLTVGKVTSVKPVELDANSAPGNPATLYYEITAVIEKSVDLRVDCVVSVESPILGNQGRLAINQRGLDPRRADATTPIMARASGLASQVATITREFDSSNPESLLSKIKSQLDDATPTSLVYKSHAILDNLRVMSGNLRTTFDPERDGGLIRKLDSVLTRLHDITRSLARETSADNNASAMYKLHGALDELDRALTLVSDLLEENRPNLKSTFAATASAAQRLDKDLLPDIQAEFSRTDPESFLAKLHVAMDDLHLALNHIKVVAEKAKHVAELGEPSLLATIHNAKVASEHLKAAGKEIRRSPWRLIHKPTADETREALLLDAVREFAESLQTVNDALYQTQSLTHEGAQDADQAELFERLRRQLIESIDHYEQAEKTLWKQLENLK